jgi:hypothetical protein
MISTLAAYLSMLTLAPHELLATNGRFGLA